MCGIFGLIKYNGDSISPDIAGRMQRALAHRGPDHRGLYAEPGLVLGINRLSIVDLTTGNQPIFNEDRSLVIVYNGELYNHSDIREDLIRRGHSFYTASDTETVLHAFEEFDAGCLDKFNGMFAFAVWDIGQQRLFLARDRLGIKPLYITRTEEGFAFASEAKGLLNVFAAPRPDWTAINRYFSFGYVPSPDSPFEGIVKLPAAHCGFLQNGKWQAARYWKPDYDEHCQDTPDQACGRIEEIMEQAVKMELMSDVPLGIFLSGGLDSSAVALFAQRCSRRPLNSYALRFEEETHDESADARLVARHLGLNHTEVSCPPDVLKQALFDVAGMLDEPFGDSTALPLLILSRSARPQVKAVLTGWGGDEIFAGYPTYRAHRLAACYRRLPSFLSNYCIPAVVNRLPVSDAYMSFEFKAKRFLKGMDLSPELQHFLWMGYYEDVARSGLFRPAVIGQVTEKAYARLEKTAADMTEKELLGRIMHLDARYFLEGNGLFQADRLTMAASLEARVPLLNRELINYVNALPVAVKMDGGSPKGLLKKMLAKYLPARIIHKPKKGFGPPVAVWVRGVFADVFDELFSRERIESQGIFNHAEIIRLLGEHRDRRADHGRNLWALLSFQLWYDHFISAKN